MKRSIQKLSLALVLALPAISFAQDDEPKITVEITKEVDGEKKTFKGEYNSVEEMHADPNYREFSDEEGDINLWFGPDEDIDLHLDLFGNQIGSSFFRFFGEDEENDQGSNYFFKHFGPDSADSFFDFHFDTDGSEEQREKMRELREEMKRMLGRFNDDNESSDFSVPMWKKVKVTDVDDEFGKKGRVDKSNELVLEDLGFHPNPSSNGRFKVRFTTPDEGELSIKVSDLKGNDIFSRYFDSFSGRYSETIDLSGQKDGVYLLEIKQDKKRLTRKIIVN